MSRNFFAATERRAATKMMKAAVFVAAFMLASLLSNGQALAGTAVNNGGWVIDHNQIDVAGVVAETLQNVQRIQKEQPNVLLDITVKGVDFALSRSVGDVVSFENIDDKGDLCFISQINLLERQASLADLANSYVLDLEASNTINQKADLLNFNIHGGINQWEVNVISLLDVPDGVQELNAVQQLKQQTLVSANLEAEEATRILLLVGPQRLTWLSKLS